MLATRLLGDGESGAYILLPCGGDWTFVALEAKASFGRVPFDDGEFGHGGAVGSAEQQDFLGRPSLLEADEVTMLQRGHQAENLRCAPAPDPDVVDHRKLDELRKELNALSAVWAGCLKISHVPRGAVHRTASSTATASSTSLSPQLRPIHSVAAVRRGID